jgi:uncharacterized protein YecE (DUF72 family)
MVTGWYARAHEGFVYTVKAYKGITHKRKLRNADEALKRFLHTIMPLKDKLGAVLFQLPPSLKRNDSLLRDFVSQLPPSPHCCFEFRHDSWECDETYDLLEQSGAGHVVVSKKDYPFIEKHTSGIAYYRLHGPEQMCASSYSDSWLETLSDHIAFLSRNSIKGFIFFNNDIGGHAVRNARSLKAFVAAKIRL